MMHIGKSTIIRFSKPQQAFPRKFQTNIKHTVPIGLILNITVFISEQVEILSHKALGYMRLALPLLGCPMRGPPPFHTASRFLLWVTLMYSLPGFFSPFLPLPTSSTVCMLSMKSAVLVNTCFPR